ncbi:ComF family protein [Cryptosporangium sp. NPDC051539]|uniref:ComF family protein n=1 Tax=Cryptosporangium sp. NPDC051539 TaxID=3363962 RepID=UPI0037996A66
MLDAVLDLVLPVRCVGCGGDRGPLCPPCALAVQSTVALAVPPGDRSGGGEPAVCVASGPYGGALRAALIAYKERGRRSLAAFLGARLAVAVAAGSGGGRLLLVPVPSSPAAIRARGGDHVLRLARHAAVTLRSQGVEVMAAPLLTQRRTPADSVGLTATERRENIAGAFGVARTRPAARARQRRGSAIVLVDDIVTTGATLTEAARAVSGRGLPVLAAAVVAATSRRGSPGPTARHFR